MDLISRIIRKNIALVPQAAFYVQFTWVRNCTWQAATIIFIRYFMVLYERLKNKFCCISPEREPYYANNKNTG